MTCNSALDILLNLKPFLHGGLKNKVSLNLDSTFSNFFSEAVLSKEDFMFKVTDWQ